MNSQLRNCEKGGFSVRLPKAGWDAEPVVSREDNGERFTWLGRNGMQWLSVLHRTQGDWTDVQVYVSGADTFETIWESVPESADDGFVAMCGAEEMASWTGSIEFSGRVCRVFVVVLRRGTESWAVEYGFPAFSFAGGPAGAEIDESDSATAGLVLGTFRCNAKKGKEKEEDEEERQQWDELPKGTADPNLREMGVSDILYRGLQHWKHGKGRASRKEYLLVAPVAIMEQILVALIAWFVLFKLSDVRSWLNKNAVYCLIPAVIGCFHPLLAFMSVNIRRWHDVGLPDCLLTFTAIFAACCPFVLGNFLCETKIGWMAICVLAASVSSATMLLIGVPLMRGMPFSNRYDNPEVQEQGEAIGFRRKSFVKYIAGFASIFILSVAVLSGMFHARIAGRSSVPKADSDYGKSQKTDPMIPAAHGILVPVPHGYGFARTAASAHTALAKVDDMILFNEVLKDKLRFVPKSLAGTKDGADGLAVLYPLHSEETTILHMHGKDSFRADQRDFSVLKRFRCRFDLMQSSAGTEMLQPDDRGSILLICCISKPFADGAKSFKNWLVSAKGIMLVDGHFFAVAHVSEYADEESARASVERKKEFLVNWAKDIKAAND